MTQNHVFDALLSRLTGTENFDQGNFSNGFVETLAKAYETARNALEYRAENLVRRAAIERILKRLMITDKDPKSLAENLLTELKWARYLDRKLSVNKKEALTIILENYTSYRGIVPGEWVIKIASAEVEELINPNKDYYQFTFFAFQAIKQKVKFDDDNLDLLIYYAVDKIYAGSDPEQIAYHIIKLAGAPLDAQKISEGFKLFGIAANHKLSPRLLKFVRRQMPPLVLLRDIYFYEPSKFGNLFTDKETFTAQAEKVLETQLMLMSGKISTAGVRSVIYVFMTKMVFAFAIEAPLETLIYGRIALLPLLINLSFPPFVMWSVTSLVKIPKKTQQEALVLRTWEIIEKFDHLKVEEGLLEDTEPVNSASPTYVVFSALYLLLFMGIFIALYYMLGFLGFKFFSKLIFIFFLTIIAFFAYRIAQIPKAYAWHDNETEKSSLIDMVLLPILTIGSFLSQGLSKLNFVVLFLDFILEAPFKLILRIVDDWVHFLSIKRDQQVLD